MEREEILKSIKDRSVEVGDCWLWNQGTSTNGYPIMKLRGCGCKLVRRLAAESAGHELKERQPVIPTCGEKLCVNPAHMKPTTISEVGKIAARRGAFSSHQRAASIAASRRSGRAKITEAIASEIRASLDPETTLAQRYGVNRSLIGRIRRGDAWRDYRNPFAGLGARP